MVGISPLDALRPLADVRASGTTGGGPDETVIGRAREACRLAPDGRDSAARQIVLCLDVIMAASRTDIAFMVAIACVCLLPPVSMLQHAAVQLL